MPADQMVHPVHFMKTTRRRLTRALVTAFLMRHLCDEDRVEPLVEGKIPGTTLPHP